MTIRDIHAKHAAGKPIVMLTAHDYLSATLAERVAGVDIVLVGDSLAMVACGYASTAELGIDEMLYHCRSVSRGSKTALRVGDLTFGTYERSTEQAIDTSVRMIREGGMEAIKLEGGLEHADAIARLTSIGIPVMGHVGLTPQRQAALSGYRVQGKTAASAMGILRDALAVQRAGAFSIVLEAMPAQLGQLVTSKLRIPTIGIGAGSDCDGQVLVQLDLLGAYDRSPPRFVKRYAEIGADSTRAIEQYAAEVSARQFPTPAFSYPIGETEWAEVVEAVERVAGD